MSEAERLGNNPESPDAIAPLSGSAIPTTQMPVGSDAPPASGDGWQTVDFPGAVSVDAIPLASAEEIKAVEEIRAVEEIKAAEEIEIVAPIAEVGHGAEAEHAVESEAAGHVRQLQQENVELRDRIAQLEQGFAQAQVELQLTTLQLWQENGDAAMQQHSESVKQVEQLAAAQEHINRLFQELELSHQTAQRQQILVETLTEQLESSQERIAQLERECALIQQRYNEQLQQLLQTENTCRDLRTRLHRQQQQALQFKVALEKSLDMSGSQRNPLSLANPTPDNSAAPGIAATGDAFSSATFALQNQPVQPWSVVEQSANLEAELSDPLAKLLSLNAEYGQPTVDLAASDLSVSLNFSGQDPEVVSSLMQQLFADDATPSTSLAVEDDQPAGIFDLGPFLEAGELSSEIVLSGETVGQEVVTLAAMTVPEAIAMPEGSVLESGILPEVGAEIADAELVQSTELAQSLSALKLESVGSIAQETQSGEALWDELARVIDATPMASGAGAIEPEQETGTKNINSEPVHSEPVKPEPQDTAANPSKRLSLLPISRPNSIRRQVAIHATSQDNPVSDSVPMTFEEALIEATTPVQATPAQADIAASWPSPVLYPMRPSRKLESMSAVQLPSFRQSTQG
jgi:hypothetical protein